MNLYKATQIIARVGMDERHELEVSVRVAAVSVPEATMKAISIINGFGIRGQAVTDLRLDCVKKDGDDDAL